MLPISVEPRAKMKVISRQSPFSSSLTVDPTRPPSCLGSTAGRAAAVEARRAMAVVNFMLIEDVRLICEGFLEERKWWSSGSDCVMNESCVGTVAGWLETVKEALMDLRTNPECVYGDSYRPCFPGMASEGQEFSSRSSCLVMRLENWKPLGVRPDSPVTRGINVHSPRLESCSSP